MVNLVPNLIIGGAQKSASTTLAHLLSRHPDVLMGKKKEPEFFSRDRLYETGTDFYRKHYETYSGERILFDASTHYLMLPFVAQRIRDMLGDSPKFIFVLRHPVDRTVSAYNHYFRKGAGEELRSIHQLVPSGLESHTLESLLAFEENLVRKSVLEGKVRRFADDSFWSINAGYSFNYFGLSCYSRQIAPYFEHFPRENFLFLTFEDVTKRQSEMLEKVARFLNIDSSKFILSDGPLHLNVSRFYRNRFGRTIMMGFGTALAPVLPRSWWYSLQFVAQRIFTHPDQQKFSSEVYSRLHQIFVPEIQRTAQMTGLDLSHWLDKYPTA